MEQDHVYCEYQPGEFPLVQSLLLSQLHPRSLLCFYKENDDPTLPENTDNNYGTLETSCLHEYGVGGVC